MRVALQVMARGKEGGDLAPALFAPLTIQNAHANGMLMERCFRSVSSTPTGQGGSESATPCCSPPSVASDGRKFNRETANERKWTRIRLYKWDGCKTGIIH